jgi:hypothetical protein
MSLLRYADMPCDCPNCGLKPSFDFPTCWVHIRWGNQYGGCFTVFCEHCRTSTTMANVSGVITIHPSNAIHNQIVHWHSKEWKIERMNYLLGIKEKFKISYRGRPDVYEKFDEELAYLEYHIRA